MSLFPKFKIPTDTPATPATIATFRAESSRNSKSSNPQAAQKPDFQVSGEDDPILPVEAWYPVFKEFHRKVVHENCDFDYGWVRVHRPDLYQAIKAKESELDALQEARLSEVMAIIREWRELVLQACFEQSELQRTEANKPQTQQGNLKLRAG